MTRPRKNRPSSASESSETAIYDGLQFLGSIRPCKTGFAAYDRDGRGVGRFATKDLARLAILSAPAVAETG